MLILSDSYINTTRYEKLYSSYHIVLAEVSSLIGDNGVFSDQCL